MFQSPLTVPFRQALVIGVLFAAVAFVGAYFTGDYNTDWYRSLQKPANLLPPDLERLIPVIWGVLYLLAGLALAAVLAADRGTFWKLFALALFLLQLGLNYSYSAVFTVRQDLPGALWIAAGLSATTALLILACAATRVWVAVVCQLPYLAWCVYATLLASEVARLNG